jgi:hypothetical protein
MIAFLIFRPMKRVGLTLPRAILARANEVIEQIRSRHVCFGIISRRHSQSASCPL